MGDDHVYRGEKSRADVRIAMAFAGHMQIELIQPKDDHPSVYRETVQSRGYGFHHIGIASADVDAEIAAYEARGYALAFRAGVPTGGSVAYLDGGPTRAGFVELIPATPGDERGFHGLLAGVGRLGREGADPAFWVIRGSGVAQTRKKCERYLRKIAPCGSLPQERREGQGERCVDKIQRQPARYQVMLVGLLSLNFGVLFFDRNALNFLMPFVQPDLGLNNTQVGLLASALSLTWAISGFLIGRLSDRTGSRKAIIVVATLAFSLCSFVSGIASSFLMLLGARLLMGFAEGGVLPISQSLTAFEVSPERRGLAMGVMQNLGVEPARLDRGAAAARRDRDGMGLAQRLFRRGVAGAGARGRDLVVRPRAAPRDRR